MKAGRDYAQLYILHTSGQIQLFPEKEWRDIRRQKQQDSVRVGVGNTVADVNPASL